MASTNDDKLSFWQQKIAQCFHDPFIKAWCQGKTGKKIAHWIKDSYLLVQSEADDPGGHGDSYQRAIDDSYSAHTLIGSFLSEILLGDAVTMSVLNLHSEAVRGLAAEREDVWYSGLATDIAAAGADRPVLGSVRQVHTTFWDGDRELRSTITHPFCHAPMLLHPKSGHASSYEQLTQVLKTGLDSLESLGEQFAGSRLVDPQHLRKLFYAFWRRLPAELARLDGGFWPLAPADTRCPDHSIWDHLKVTSSLSYLPGGKTPDHRRMASTRAKLPWLLSLWVGPVNEFFVGARKGRDLWSGSMMISELAWAMAQPILEHYGPDSLIYPDLRGNPRADVDLARDSFLRQVLPEHQSRPGTRAALIPNRIVAVIPEGGSKGFPRVHDLAEQCQANVQERWSRMVEEVAQHLSKEDRLGSGSWVRIFREQLAAPPNMRWVAVPWVRDEDLDRISREDIEPPPAIPFQVDIPESPRKLRELEQAREARFSGWVDEEAWQHYQTTRHTYLKTYPKYVGMERGFDYALTHHKLRALDRARSMLGNPPARRQEPGEKCSLCGQRQALTSLEEYSGEENMHKRSRPIPSVGERRQAARELWRRKGVDPEETGAERLCGFCALRRFLTDSEDGISAVWENSLTAKSRGRKHKVPFPSTSALAMQRYLARLCEEAREEGSAVRAAVGAFIKAYAGTPATQYTQFADAVPRLRKALSQADPVIEEFLRIDAQLVLPESWEGRIRKSSHDRARLQQARRAAGDLRVAMARCAPTRAGEYRRDEFEPATHLAVIVLDGDHIGRLLLGSPEQVQVPWRHVLHPDAVDTITKRPDTESSAGWKPHWRTTLEHPRLMGPSTHAFLSRALANFAHRVVPWVSEMEFGGRLIYAGGDDALILCPAADALGLVQRLAEIFQAPWVWDAQPDESAWRTKSSVEVDSPQAKQRFTPLRGGAEVLDLNRQAFSRQTGEILPMLGPHQSFSAGITYGPMKTSIHHLMAEARRNLEQVAKSRMGGGTVAMTWFTRNGAKMRHAMHLGANDEATRDFEQLVHGIRSGQLASRVPYKLRPALPAARAILDDSDRAAEEGPDPQLQELVSSALGSRQRPHAWVVPITRVWQQGLALARPRTAASPDPSRSSPDQSATWETDANRAAEQSLGGLLMARALAKLNES